MLIELIAIWLMAFWISVTILQTLNAFLSLKWVRETWMFFCSLLILILILVFRFLFFLFLFYFLFSIFLVWFFVFIVLLLCLQFWCLLRLLWVCDICLIWWLVGCCCVLRAARANTLRFHNQLSSPVGQAADRSRANGPTAAEPSAAADWWRKPFEFHIARDFSSLFAGCRQTMPARTASCRPKH